MRGQGSERLNERLLCQQVCPRVCPCVPVCARWLHDCCVQVVEGCTHFGPMEDPDALAALIHTQIVE